MQFSTSTNYVKPKLDSGFPFFCSWCDVITLMSFLLVDRESGLSSRPALSLSSKLFILFVYLTLKNPVPYSRYKILCANLIKEPQDPLKTTQFILDYVNLDAQQYRMGHTKVHT